MVTTTTTMMKPPVHDGIIKMVAGFLFLTESPKIEVALVRKLRPRWQREYLNGIGGHIEDGESPHNAMVREFAEETGLRLSAWMNFARLHGYKYFVDFFEARVDSLPRALESRTDEEIAWYPVEAVLQPNTLIIPNLRWLIPMALDRTVPYERPYHIVERPQAQRIRKQQNHP